MSLYGRIVFPWKTESMTIRQLFCNGGSVNEVNRHTAYLATGDYTGGSRGHHSASALATSVR